MKYQRWYPTGVTLPDGRILILSGTDQDTSVGPEEASSTKVRQAGAGGLRSPHRQDDRAGKCPQAVQHVSPLLCDADGTRQGRLEGVCGRRRRGATAPGRAGRGLTSRAMTHSFTTGIHTAWTSWRRWQTLTATCRQRSTGSSSIPRLDAHDSGAGVRMVTINADGTWSQKVFLFGGNSGEGSDNVAIAEMIDFSDEDPKWERIDDLAMPAGQNNVVALPDGKLLVVGGRESGINSLHYQLYDPADGTRQDLIESPVPRHDHSTALLQPNGGVWIMGGNRVQLIGETQPERDLAVPVLEFYQPPYFFKGPRPVIEKAPEQIHYGQQFKLDVSDARRRDCLGGAPADRPHHPQLGTGKPVREAALYQGEEWKAERHIAPAARAGDCRGLPAFRRQRGGRP